MINRKVERKDNLVILAVLSYYLVLMTQFLFLNIFNSSNYTQYIQFFFKMLVFVFYLLPIKYVINKKVKTIFIWFVFFSIVYLANMLFFPNNTKTLLSNAINFFLMIFPNFIYSLCINDISNMMIITEKTSKYVFFIGICIGALTFTNIINIGLYSQSFSYYMLLPALFFLEKFLSLYDLKNFLGVMISLILILAFGSRGAIFSVLTFFILYQIINISVKSWKKLFFNIFLFFLLFIFIFFLKDIMALFQEILVAKGLYSRNLDLFLQEDVFLSGREVIYSTVINCIIKNPFFGIGLTGDRYVTGGFYSHNFFLEVFSSFGIIIGCLLICIIFYLVINNLRIRSLKVNNFLLIWFCLGFIPLMISGSFLTHYEFWTFLGLNINILTNKKNII